MVVGVFMKIAKLIFTLCMACGTLFPHAIMADALTGVGFVQIRGEAKKEALADLSQVIKVDFSNNSINFFLNTNDYVTEYDANYVRCVRKQ